MIRQKSNGSPLNTAMVSGSQADLEALAVVLEGEVEIFTLESEGGVEASGLVLNPIGFSVGKKKLSGSYLSVGINLQHLKPTKTFKDISAHVKGVWDADFTSGQLSAYCNGFRATSKG